MPEVPFSHVVSCSSQDSAHPVDNLLKEDYKKWISGSPGEQQVTVVLQLCELCKISSVHIGNEGSALIEVQVGRSADGDGLYKTLICASSFMSPIESRSGNQTNRVRMFDSSKFDRLVARERWDRIKVVCTQPFAKTKYGLSFIRVSTTDELKSQKDKGEKKSSVIMTTPVKEENSSPGFTPGSLFARRKMEAVVPKNDLSSASIRNAADTFVKHAESKLSIPKELSALGSSSLKISKPDHPSDLDPDKAGPSKPRTPTTTPIAEKRAEKRKETPTSEKRKETVDKEKPKEKEGPARLQHKNDRKRSSDDKAPSPVPPVKKPRAKPERKVDFSKLLSGVNFVLSGYQNPERGQIRDKATSMGARYSGDWNPKATHLVAAFASTPKVNAVKGTHAKIVSADWILKCHEKRRKLPWRKFAVLKRDQGESDSEDEVVIARPAPPPRNIYDFPTDEESSPENAVNLDPDTNLPVLPTFFENDIFFIDPQIDGNERKEVVRYIESFSGKIRPYMQDDVTTVISCTMRPELADYDVTVVSPDWVMDCGKKGKKVDTKNYVVS